MNKPIILLFGMPRSGTTWIGKIFDSHERTLYRHEPDTWNKITQIPLLANTENTEKYCDFVNSYVEEFTYTRRPEVNGKLPFFSKSYASAVRESMFRGSVLFSSAVSRIKSDSRLPVVRPFSMSRSEELIVTWKSIQLLGRMGVISKCLPNCRGVVILRHPCGYISSVLSGESKKKFTSYVAASEDYPLYEKMLETSQARRYGLTMDGFKALSPEERLAWRWVLFNEKALDDTADEQNIKPLKYEDMCVDPVGTAKEYFEFCGLEWSAQTERFLSQSTTKNSDSYYSVFKNPEQAANKWRKVLDIEKIKLVEAVVMQSSVGKFYQNSF